MAQQLPSDEAIIAHCRDATPDMIVSQPECSNKLILLEDELIVKCGSAITHGEAVNQEKAYELLDRSIVRVPKVHKFLSDDEERGYIVMDYLSGQRIESPENPHQVAAIMRIFEHLASFHHDVPGPPSLNAPEGLLWWPYDKDVPFPDVASLEQWWNAKLVREESKLDLTGLDLVLCHLDVAPRNILWDTGKPPGLVDWASAGFYPKLFEVCSQRVMEETHGIFHRLLLDAMTPLAPLEEKQVEPILIAWGNMQVYSFPQTNNKPWTPTAENLAKLRSEAEALPDPPGGYNYETIDPNKLWEEMQAKYPNPIPG